MSTTPERRKPTLLANLILLVGVFVVLAVLAFGGWFVLQKFVFAQKAGEKVAVQTQSAPQKPVQDLGSPEKEKPSGAGRPGVESGAGGETAGASQKRPRRAPGLIEAPAGKGALDKPTDSAPPAGEDVPVAEPSLEATVPGERVVGAIPSAPPTTSPGNVVAPTDPNVTAVTPNTAVPEPPPAVDQPLDIAGGTPPEPAPAGPDPVEVFSEESPEVKALKADADRRIDEAPDDLYPPREKARVRSALRDAKRIAKIATVHFPVGGASLSPAAKTRLKNSLLAEDASELMSDPEAAIVSLGFADPTGDPQKNKALSKQRAMSVIDALKEMGVTNVTYPVAIGGTEIISDANKDKNRAVELWLVLQ